MGVIMAKSSKEKAIVYEVLIGFNDDKDKRFEVGELIADGVLSFESIEALLEMKAIKLKGE